MPRTLEEQISLLYEYSACDISDALLKLQKPLPGKAAKAGYLADIVPYAPSSPFNPTTSQPKIVGPASTLKLIDKSNPSSLPPIEPESPNAIPKSSHWSDVTDPGTILVIDQPLHQTCAAIGGIMASRMKIRGLKACVVSGRVRDLAELKESGLPIYARSRSTVGQGAEAKVYARNIPLIINDIEIKPNDILHLDPLEGLVVIPSHLVDEVLDLMPLLGQADEKVKADVMQGIGVQEAFGRHRDVSKLMEELVSR